MMRESLCNVICIVAFASMTSAAILKCSDYKGALVRNGREYAPDKKEPCKVCTCDRGFPGTCRKLPCSPPPKNCKHVAHAEGCCKYICLDRFVRGHTGTTPPEADNCTDVAIVGAGVSGAYAAWLLRRRNFTVDVYEYSNRIGGRLHTVNLPYIPDVNVELGGMRFAPQLHAKFNKLVRTLNLETIPMKAENSTGELLYYVRGRQLRKKDLTNRKIPYFLQEDEQGKSPEELRWKFFSENTNFTARGRRQYRVSRDLLEISTKDGLMLHEQSYDTVISQVASTEAYNFIKDTTGYTSFFGQTSASVYYPLGEPRHSGYLAWRTLKHGMHHLPKSLLDQALKNQSSRLHLNHRLTKIQPLRTGRYQLTFRETVTKRDGYTRDIFGKDTFVKTCAKKIILALPRMGLAGVTMRGIKKHRLYKRYLEAVDDTKALRIYFGFEKAWWEDLKVKFAGIITDLPLKNVRPIRVSKETGRAVLLVVYKDVDVSYWKQLSRLGKPIRGSIKTPYVVTNHIVHHVKRHLAEIIGIKMADIPNPISGAMYIWQDYPFGAAYNMWLPGYDWDDVRKVMSRPAAKEHVYTVGSAFSFHDNQAFVEGALGRVEEVVNEYF